MEKKDINIIDLLIEKICKLKFIKFFFLIQIAMLAWGLVILKDIFGL